MKDSLILDIKYHIARYDENVWYSMYVYDPEFRTYACSIKGAKAYETLFNLSAVNIDEVTIWRMFGRIHRGSVNSIQQPAVISKEGNIIYYRNGERYRESINGIQMPALITIDGIMEYYHNGVLHREHDENGVEQPSFISKDCIS